MHLHGLTQFAASKLSIENYEFMIDDEVLACIEAANETIHALLLQHFADFSRWYDLHESIDASGNSGNLTPAQSANVIAFSEARENSKNELTQALKNC